MRKIYLLAGLLGVYSLSFAQAPVIQTPNKKGVMNRINTDISKYERKNVTSSRTTNISRWVSYWDAYAAYTSATLANYTMSNGPFVNGPNVHMKLTSGVDTAFTSGAYSVIDLNGEFYESTHFDDNVLPFDPATQLTIDSLFMLFNYERYDTNTIDTVVVRIAVGSSSPAQMQSVYNYNAPNNLSIAGDTLRWLGVTFNTVTREIKNKVFEHKVALTSAFLNDSNNWINNDSTWLGLVSQVSGTISGHQGILAVEVNVIPGKQLTSADTVGQNANWFSPTWRCLGSTAPPYYSPNGGDWTSGGILYTDEYTDASGTGIFYSHWFGNSANQFNINGQADVFQTPFIELHINQTNSFNASINELTNGAKLFQNYPNPSNGLTTVKYELEDAAQVSFEVVDITGKTVVSSYEGNKTNGVHTINIDTKSLKAGVYFYSIVVNGNKLTKKMTVNK